MWLALACVLSLRRRGRTNAARGLSTIACALLAGTLVSCIALVPAFELATHGVRRTRRTLSFAAMYPLGPLSPSEVLDYWLGSTPPFAALAALFVIPAVLTRHRRLLVWASAVGLFTLLAALGPATPIFRLYVLLPFVGWFREPHRGLLVTQFCVAILIAIGAQVVTARAPFRRFMPAVVAATLLALLADGLRTTPPPLPLPYGRAATSSTEPLRRAYEELAAEIGGARVWPFSPGPFLEALPPKLPTLARLRSIEDSEPLTLKRHEEYVLFLATGRTSFVSPHASFDGRITRLSPGSGEGVRDAGPRARPSPLRGLEVFENPHALPRAFVTYRTRRAPSDARDLLRALAQPDFDPSRESFVEDDDAVLSPPGDTGRAAAAVIVRDEPQVVEVDATLDRAGLLILADTFDPHWLARIDGTPAAVVPTNHLVVVPAGTHRIRFEYRPRGLWIGLLLSGSAMSTLLLLGLRAPNSSASRGG